jgi:SAM-dependent methyltransferase
MEGYEASTYGDRIASVYDAWYEERLDPTSAVDFLAALASGGRALELGIGTGRVAIPLKQRGVEVHGIDASESMLDQLRAKSGGADIPVTVGDFTDVPVPGRFELIYVPFTTFFALESQEHQLRCMRQVAGHLEPNGRFVIDAFVPDLTRFTDNQSTMTVETSLGHLLVDAVRHDPLTQTIEGHHVAVENGSVKLYPLRVRYCWPSELDLMARLAGLALEQRFAWYDRSPFEATSKRHVSVYVSGGSSAETRSTP